MFTELKTLMKGYTITMLSKLTVDDDGRMTVLVSFKHGKDGFSELSPITVSGTPEEIDAAIPKIMERAKIALIPIQVRLSEFDASNEKLRKELDDKKKASTKGGKVEPKKPLAPSLFDTKAKPNSCKVEPEEEEDDDNPEDDQSEETDDLNQDDGFRRNVVKDEEPDRPLTRDEIMKAAEVEPEVAKNPPFNPPYVAPPVEQKKPDADHKVEEAKVETKFTDEDW